MFFSFFLGVQIVFNDLDIFVSSQTDKTGIYEQYQKAFKETVLMTTENNVVKLSDVKSPIVILKFWASWCSPCLDEFKALVEFKKKFSDEQIVVFAITGEHHHRLNEINKAKRKVGINFPVILDHTGKIFSRFQINKIPSSIIFKDGKVFKHSNDESDLWNRDKLDRLYNLLKIR